MPNKDSFKHAVNGLIYSVKTQPNLRFHLVIAFIVIVLGWMFEFSQFEWIILILTISMVIITELINTAIESLTDLITIKYSKHAKDAKDVSAGMVFATTITSVIIGIILFTPHIVNLFS